MVAEPSPGHTRFSHRIFQWLVRGVFRFYCPLRVIGRENLPPGRFILCSNHASHIDSFALMTAAGFPFGTYAMLAAGDYFFRNSIGGRWFSGLVHLIPISRSSSLVDRAASLNRTILLCRSSLQGPVRCLILFPEGTRSVTGETGPFKRGISLIAAELGLPIVPAYIEGSRTVMPKGRLFPVPGRIGVHIGAPIFPGAERNHDAIGRAIEISIRSLKGGPGAFPGFNLFSSQ
jgi:1-acyl-sn-glycerol-3-phosphate acyltransferase